MCRRKRVRAHLFILLIFRTGWLDWAKFGPEITDVSGSEVIIILWLLVKEKPRCSRPPPETLPTCAGTADVSSNTGCDKAPILPSRPYKDGFETSDALHADRTGGGRPLHGASLITTTAACSLLHHHRNNRSSVMRTIFTVPNATGLFIDCIKEVE